MKKYGLIGYPLSHSFSSKIFSAKFKDEGLDCTYENFPLESLKYFPSLISQEKLLCGLNVTLPYKREIIHYLDEIDDIASKTGAVNLIRIEREGDVKRLVGFNTDVYGFVESLKPLLTEDIKTALILGTGGSSLAVAKGLDILDIEYQHVSRGGLKEKLKYTDLSKEIISDHLLIINATPVGMYPETGKAPPIPYRFLSEAHLLFDLVYNPEQTLFMKNGISARCRVSNGLEMLLKQAHRSWEVWNF